MRKISFIELITDAVLGFGIMLIISPIFLYWFIHGSYERYIWIIKGPYPFDSFGSGPFQLWMIIGLFITGVLLSSIAILIKKNLKE